MIVSRLDFERILASAKGDRMGLTELGELEVTQLVAYARLLRVVLVQAQRLVTESGHALDTPCQASLMMALYQADPLFFQFDDCARPDICLANGCLQPDCRRQVWRDTVRRRALTPLPLRRAWWRFWRRG